MRAGVVATASAAFSREPVTVRRPHWIDADGDSCHTPNEVHIAGRSAMQSLASGCTHTTITVTLVR